MGSYSADDDDSIHDNVQYNLYYLRHCNFFIDSALFCTLPHSQ